MPVNLNNMKSLLEIVTILVLLFSFTMLEKMDDTYCPNRPGPFRDKNRQPNKGRPANIVALATGSSKATIKPAK